MSSKIKAILFDLGNVLVNFDADRAIAKFSSDCAIDATVAKKYFFSSEDEQSYARGHVETEEFFAKAQKALNIEIDFERFKKYWCEIFWENEGMDALVAALKKNYKLYLISNTNYLHFEYIKKNFSVLDHFDGLFPSHEVGELKPSKEIFKKVLDEVDLAAEETIFIDDIQAFSEAASELGIYGLHFRGKEQLLDDFKKIGILV